MRKPRAIDVAQLSQPGCCLVSSMSSTPTPKRRAQSAATSDWPLLASLPDVLGQRTADMHGAKRLAAATTSASQFDAKRIEDNSLTISHASAEQDDSLVAAEKLNHGFSLRLPQPHVHQRTWRVDQVNPKSRATSAALPSSNPFAIPPTSLHDALAPVVRFVMLVVMFTAAGTTIIMAGKADQRKPEPNSPAAPAAQPLLEPTSIMEPAVATVEPAATATGPSRELAAPHFYRLIDSVPPFPDIWSPPANPSADSDDSSGEKVTSDPSLAPSNPADSAADFRSSPLTNNGHTLPQVRTSEPPAAVAHLPGHILESPSRQASNDDEPSVY
jgi:hypothetical protein